MGVLPKYLEAPWSQLGPRGGFYPWDEWSSLSSLVGISGAGAHSGLALCIFHSLCSVHLGTICKGKNIAGSSLLKALHFLEGGNTRQEKKKKNRMKKVLDCFSSANCSLRQVIVVKSIHKYSDSSLIKYQAWDLFKCQQPPSLPAYCRVFFISKCFLFHRKSKSNLGGQRAQKSKIKMFLACPMNQLTTLCSPQWKQLQ